MLSDKSNFLVRAFSRLKVKHKQYIAAFLVGTIFIGVLVVIYYRISSTLYPASVPQKKIEEANTKRIESAVSRSNPTENWKQVFENDKDKIQDDIEGIKKALSESMEYLATKERDNDFESLQNQLNELKNLVLNKQNTSPHLESFEDSPEIGEERIEAIERVVFNLEPKQAKANKNIEENIPAGAFAKAIILGGVDGATTLNAPGDPRPMLLRLTDAGTLPRRFKSDLKDCHIVASGYGDLSSERVMVRLEKLSCVERETGEIIETQVAGYVAGEDGIGGVRGVVVEKSQKYLLNSIAGGLLQGVAGVLTPQQAFTLNPMGATANKESHTDKFARGAGSGAAGSMERLSKYYLESAERLQPVIQVAAGREVDVVFNEGVEIGTTLIKEKLEARRKIESEEFKLEEGE